MCMEEYIIHIQYNVIVSRTMISRVNSKGSRDPFKFLTDHDNSLHWITMLSTQIFIISLFTLFIATKAE